MVDESCVTFASAVDRPDAGIADRTWLIASP
jgi:hypothetical protein